MNANEIELLKKFLRKHRVIRAWNKYTALDHGNVDKYLDNESINQAISGAFVWSETEQRHDFWRKLDKKWSIIWKASVSSKSSSSS